MAVDAILVLLDRGTVLRMHEGETRAEIHVHFVDRLALGENQVALDAGGEDVFARGGLSALVVAAEAAG